MISTTWPLRTSLIWIFLFEAACGDAASDSAEWMRDQVLQCKGNGPIKMCAWCGEYETQEAGEVVCRLDDDCPTGWTCVSGCCAESFGCGAPPIASCNEPNDFPSDPAVVRRIAADQEGLTCIYEEAVGSMCAWCGPDGGWRHSPSKGCIYSQECPEGWQCAYNCCIRSLGCEMDLECNMP